MVDARLPDGSRVNAIIPPLALDGPAVSIRRFGTGPLGASKLVELKSASAEMLELLSQAVRARISILISGGTGAGKTTFLNMLSQYVPRERANRHDRGCRGVATRTGKSGAAGDAAAERRGPRRYPAEAASDQQLANAAGPDHRG